MNDPNSDLDMIDATIATVLSRWELPEHARIQRINVSENVTYMVEAGSDRFALRVHRPGYHSRNAIASELAWIDALQSADIVRVPAPRIGRDGTAIQCADFPDGSTRFLVLFDFVDGRAPREDGDLAQGFQELGAIAARTHHHSIGWRRPPDFERLTWDLDAVFGESAYWGDWRAAPNVTSCIQEVLEAVEEKVRERLSTFGESRQRFGLIHADMRLANLIRTPDETVLIDFDDCGFGWFLYDFAAAISFIEDSPQVPALKTAWLRGYRSVRPLPEDDAAEIDSFVMLRRMALLAWIGSHFNAPEPQALAPNFARLTAELGRRYLDGVPL